MGLRINTNVASLQAQNNLKKTTKDLNQSLTRLSTGLRINAGKDDVVGLSQSELLRARIRGIDQAKSNITNGSAKLGVAEGVLSQLTEIAQQMNSLAVQAADESISGTDRTALQGNLTSLMSEYNRLAKADFNGTKLVDGSFLNIGLQVDTKEGDTINVSIEDARSSAIGKIAVMTTGLVRFSQTGAGISTMSFGDMAGLTVAGSTIATTAFSTDGVSYMDSDESAIAYVNAINSYTGTTGVTAQVLANVVTTSYASSYTLDGTSALVMNGVTIKSADGNSYDTSDDDDVAALVVLINAKTSQTGVVASQDAGSNVLTLTASDGRNISTTVIVNGADSQVSSNAFGLMGASTIRGITYRGTYKLTSADTFAVSGATDEFSIADQSYGLNDATTLDNLDFTSAANAGTAISILNKVIEQLQSRRADVGSTINRLEIAEAELSSRQENLSAAESAIRDADVATETAKFTQMSILQQAGATVLAQANASPQIALTLLQNL